MKVVTLIAALTGAAMFGSSAHADDKIALPLGSWGNVYNGVPSCAKPFLGIQPKRIIIRMESGFGRCPIIKLTKKGRTIFGSFKCEWDKSMSPDDLIDGDGDPDAFSIRVISKTKIMYNNTEYQFCGPLAGGVR